MLASMTLIMACLSDLQSVNTKFDLNSTYEDEQNAGRQQGATEASLKGTIAV